jgi:peroxiredoxin
MLTMLSAIAVLSIALVSHQAWATATVGGAAPTFSLPRINAPKGDVSLADLSAGKKATVVMFVSVQCPYSNAYNERMTSLAAQFGEKGVAFAGVYSDQGESAEDIAAHAEEHKFPFPALKDKGNVVSDAYGASHTPEVYVIDAKGMVVYHGRIDDSTEAADVHSHDLANALNEILAGKAVATPETKAFGCSIKRG